MVNRPAGGARSKRWEKSQYDYYREGPRPVQQLMSRIDFGDDLIWDCCCGGGNVLDVAREWGNPVIGSDLVDRSYHRAKTHPFFCANVFAPNLKMPSAKGRATSIITNPPYSYEYDRENGLTIAERIISHVLAKHPVRMAAFILPIAFLAGQKRWGRLLAHGRPRPTYVCFYTERHTMPPGDRIDDMATPYEGGMADYVALVFKHPYRFRTEAVWLPNGVQTPPTKKEQ